VNHESMGFYVIKRIMAWKFKGRRDKEAQEKKLNDEIMRVWTKVLKSSRKIQYLKIDCLW